MQEGKCPSYPYKRTGAGYIWDRKSMDERVIYVRYVHGRVRCRTRRPKRPKKPKKPIKPSKPDEYCECIATKPSMSYCYYWTDEIGKLCDSRPCGQKYECIGPAQRGKMNCLVRKVDFIIVPKYPGARKCKYEKVGKNGQHVVPYDFPEGV